MTRNDLEREALLLPIDDRLRLAETIWASVDREPTQPTLPEWQRSILDQRIAPDDVAPERASAWSEVKKRILSTL